MRYLECRGCGSHYLDPMPTEEMVRAMYGPAYAEAGGHEPGVRDPKDLRPTVGWLSTQPRRGVFVDYGCGHGELLVRAAALGWEVLGIEKDAAVARDLSIRTGLRISTASDPLVDGFADVLHLGDVIEHLTRLDEQFPAMLRLLKAGGTLLAQGPLEANVSPFTLALRFARAVRGGRLSKEPPYHVILATAAGQRKLFARFGLAEETFHTWEASWPAPDNLGSEVLLAPRRLFLLVLRRVSQAITALRGPGTGNRFFFVGKVSEPPGR